jgi:hypothetical protein
MYASSANVSPSESYARTRSVLPRSMPVTQPNHDGLSHKLNQGPHSTKMLPLEGKTRLIALYMRRFHRERCKLLCLAAD